VFTLIIEDKQGVIIDEYSFEDGEFVVGRSHQADIVLQSDNVSRRHARLFTQNGKCFVEDLKAANGIWLNGKRIYNTAELPKSAQLRIGDFFLHLEGASAPRTVNTVVYGRLVPVAGSIGVPTDLSQPTILVGRGKDCGIVLHDVSVSRIHAKISHLADGRITVEDLRSSNGTFVNDRRVENQELANGDRLRFGTVAFGFQMEGQPDVQFDEAQGSGNRLIPPPAGPRQYAQPPRAQAPHATAADSLAPSALLAPPRSVLPQIALVAVIAVAAVCLIVLVGIVYDKWLATHAAPPAPVVAPTPVPVADVASSPPVDRGQFDAYLTRGQDAVARRQWDEAQDLFEKARKIDAIHPRPTEALNLINREKRNGARFLQAEAVLAKHDYEAAIQANKSISQDSVYRADANKALEAIAELLEMDGDAACLAKDWIKCQNFYLTAIATDFAKPEVSAKYAKAMKKHHER
jgi:pSer/pThr/pTyr-binding forkhead associated (FHA) protein